MTEINADGQVFIEDAGEKTGRPRTVRFASAKHTDIYDDERFIGINVVVANGDAIGIINAVKEQGGIGNYLEDGRYVFIPWPPACIEIIDEEPASN